MGALPPGLAPPPPGGPGSRLDLPPGSGGLPPHIRPGSSDGPNGGPGSGPNDKVSINGHHHSGRWVRLVPYFLTPSENRGACRFPNWGELILFSPIGFDVLISMFFLLSLALQGPSGGPLKLGIVETCERIKEEFNFVQNQYHK